MEDPDYYDIDDIIATQEKLPATFLTEVVGVGALDPTNYKPDLPEGSKVEIPFWLAERMVKRGILTIDLPKFYGPEYRGKLKAGPTAVALSDWSPSYYHLGVKLSKLSDAVNIDFEVREELINLLPLLRHAFVQRFRGIILTDHTHVDDLTELTRKLDNVERKLVHDKEEALRNYQAWKKRRTDEILPADTRQRNKRART